jgi:hypothetical protein
MRGVRQGGEPVARGHSPILSLASIRGYRELRIQDGEETFDSLLRRKPVGAFGRTKRGAIRRDGKSFAPIPWGHIAFRRSLIGSAYFGGSARGAPIILCDRPCSFSSSRRYR